MTVAKNCKCFYREDGKCFINKTPIDEKCKYQIYRPCSFTGEELGPVNNPPPLTPEQKLARNCFLKDTEVED